MKRNFLLIMILALVGTFGMSAVNLKGAHYQGIAKMKGKPIDLWLTLELDDEDIEVNIGEVSNFASPYTKTETGNNVTVSFTVPGSPKAVLKSTDGGSSFEGLISIADIKYDVWVLRVPKKLKPAEQSDEELSSILASPDGYTAFCVLDNKDGKASVTCDFSFTPDGKFSLTCDSPSMQDIFTNFKGTYSVNNGEVTLNSVAGVSFSGPIYDNGNYIKIPVGRKSGMGLTLILIR